MILKNPGKLILIHKKYKYRVTTDDNTTLIKYDENKFEVIKQDKLF